MLKYKVGNLISAAEQGEVEIIAHQCNCFNAMGAGIAPQIAEAFPEAQQADNETVRGNKDKLGTCSVGYSPNGVINIFNLYGQYRTSSVRQATDYTALRKSLRAMVNHEEFTYWEEPRIGLPKIGAGLGGGDWTIISKIIEEELEGYDVTIYVLDEKEIPANG